VTRSVALDPVLIFAYSWAFRGEEVICIPRGLGAERAQLSRPSHNALAKISFDRASVLGTYQ
jgi:hypothetical protein